jgi:hypothetical protein
VTNDTLQQVATERNTGKLVPMTNPTTIEWQTVTVPPTFFADHADRGCVVDSGDYEHRAYPWIVKGSMGSRANGWKASRTITVRLHPADVRDLMSDAEHYASSAQDYGREMFGLCSSARATVIALMKQGVDRTTTYYIKGA